MHMAFHKTVLEGTLIAVEAHFANRRRLACRGVRCCEPACHVGATRAATWGDVGHAVARGTSEAIPRGVLYRSSIGHWLRRLRVASVLMQLLR